MKWFKRKKQKDNNLYVLQKDNFFGIKYNKIVKLVDIVNKEYVVIEVDRQRIQLSPTNELVITTNPKEICLARIEKKSNKINYLVIEGGV